MNRRIRILAVDDETSILSLIKLALADETIEVETATDGESAWRMIRVIRPEIVILDLGLPGVHGMKLLDRIVEWNPSVQVVLLTGEYRVEYAVEAIQRGACDYLTKPIPIAVLRERIGRLIAEARQRLERIALEEAFLENSHLGGMIGRSPEMLEIFGKLQRIAPHYRCALITGQTGTGKELAARALHSLSPVSSKAFVVCNCAAVVEGLFESELFGHVRGAFTGAIQDRTGLFESAEGGTIFLDEIGEVPVQVQAKLLRVLQNYEILRVGSSTVRHIDVRVIAATNRDIREMANLGHFREDLYYRLSMVRVHLPALADRKQDLPLLQRYFLKMFSERFQKDLKGFTVRAQALLSHYSWPGNVREMENVIGHACMMADRDTIDVRDLPEEVRNFQRTEDRSEAPALTTLAEAEARHARYVLEKVGGNKQEAAAILNISRNTLYRILKEPIPPDDRQLS